MWRRSIFCGVAAHQQWRSPWCLPPGVSPATTSIPSSIATPPLLVTRDSTNTDIGPLLNSVRLITRPHGLQPLITGVQENLFVNFLENHKYFLCAQLNGLSAGWAGAMTANTRVQTRSTWKYAFHANIFVNIKGEIVPFWQVWLHNFDILWRLHV